MESACKAFERNLVLYYFGECPEADRGDLEAHLRHCSACGRYLEELRLVLPRAVKTDRPPDAFWEGYSKELSAKLAAAEARRSRWQSFLSVFQPWPLPAFATALAVILALTLTLKHGGRHGEWIPPEQSELIEILPVAQNLEFFRAMEILDSMDLLEAMEGA